MTHIPVQCSRTGTGPLIPVETNNRCLKNECLSLSKLTECEFGNWILKSLSYEMPEIENQSKISFLRDCLIKNDPEQRCSFTLVKTFLNSFY